jgi:hypothetical protein
MHGGRGINLPKAETKKYFTDKKQWEQAVNDINSSKYDDNSDYIGVTGRSTVEINGREWARWSDAQQKGYIELSSMSEQGVAEAEAPLKHHTARVSYRKEGDPHRRYEAIFKTTHNGGKEETEKRAKAAFAAKKKIVYDIVHEQGVAEGSSTNAEVTKRAKAAAQKAGKTFNTDGEYRLWYAITTQANAATRKADKKQGVAEEQLDELSCWSGYTRVQGVPAGAPGSCKKKTNEEGVAEEQEESCPHCGGPMFSEMIMNEKKDACYYKVKSRYKVWPSAYASGALVKCRKSGADSWGNGGKKNESIEEGLDEAVGDNYLYHATQPGGIMRILRTGVIKASDRPQAATKSKTQYPTVSTTRSKQYAESEDFVDFLNLTRAGNSVIIVFDRNAVANHYKMFSTSQGTQTVGDEFEEVIVVPKGVMPIQGTMKGFYFNPRRTAEIEEFKDIPWFKELLNSPYYMGQKQGVAEEQLDEKWTKKYKDSINCSNPKGFSQKAHCAGKQKNESAIMKGLK